MTIVLVAKLIAPKSTSRKKRSKKYISLREINFPIHAIINNLCRPIRIDAHSMVMLTLWHNAKLPYISGSYEAATMARVKCNGKKVRRVQNTVKRRFRETPWGIMADNMR